MPDFWYHNPRVLYTEYHDIVPKTYDTLEKKLNAIMRFAIYIGVIATLIAIDARFLLFPILVGPLTLAFYKNQMEEGLKNTHSYSNVVRQSKENPYMNLLPYDDYPAKYVPKKDETFDNTVDNTESKLADGYKWGDLWRSFGEIYDSNIAKRQFYHVENADPVEARTEFVKHAIASEFPETSCKEGNYDQCIKNQNVGYFELKR
jgi:hypothetical protein